MSLSSRRIATQYLSTALRQSHLGTRHVSTSSSSPIASSSKLSQPEHPSASTLAETSKSAARPRVIFSGIQPTGIPHLGNYLGALRNWVDLQNASRSTPDELYFSIVGYHAITMPQQPSRLRSERAEMMATLLAIGLDPQRCTIFHQHHVAEHTELAWILNCLTAFGKLHRMTTWKAKLATTKNVAEGTEVDDKDLSLGLFAYPVLQAADILLYKATHVPVGEDQIQHLELSRDLADVYNRRFSKRFFPLPQHIITPTKRVLSLRDPASKMSKSAPDVNSRILITDTPAQAASKIKKAVTDAERSLAYDTVARPGVSNLLSILAALKTGSGSGGEVHRSPQEWAEQLNAEIAASGASSGQHLKATLTEAIVETLRPIQVELEKLRQDPGYLQQMEQLGREKAQTVARRTMAQVRKSVGLE
ncbi:probable MSW1-tryptophanyl-tRNA synthetase, mitochondrial [Sporisorium reilianum f. sp. reilianum]|uniref:Tryptophan--tRNA ligase, mitochondrial n=1 Tax=Sporisorium reilianum f. sp. reilianum TaxID=72559 RepID=A0A2N8UEW4_9BASI|nr:probable MSW1-tryptophanyl-tRNA synthetase, mitochondrial [Sporisorium reilianum f. sp. reilianum]